MKHSSGVGNAPDAVIASKKGAQDAIDGIVARLQGGVPWKNCVQYGESQGHKLGKPIRCDTHSLKEILAFVALSFEPDRKDDVVDTCAIPKCLLTRMPVSTKEGQFSKRCHGYCQRFLKSRL